MNPIEPAELSGHLDGELSPERAREVEAALARDPQLRAALAALRRDDARWRAAAHKATAPSWKGLSARGIATHPLTWMGVLLCVRLLPKLEGSLASLFLINSLALALILLWVVARTRSPAHPPAAA